MRERMRGAEALFPWCYLSSTGVLFGGPGPALGQKFWRKNRAKDQARDEQWTDRRGAGEAAKDTAGCARKTSETRAKRARHQQQPAHPNPLG